MRLTIQRKTFLATFALATTMALLLVLAMRWNLEQGFERYTAGAEFSRLDWLIRNIEDEYAAHGSWDFLRAAPQETWRRMQRRDAPDGGPADRPPPPPEAGDGGREFFGGPGNAPRNLPTEPQSPPAASGLSGSPAGIPPDARPGGNFGAPGGFPGAPSGSYQGTPPSGRGDAYSSGAPGSGFDERGASGGGQRPWPPPRDGRGLPPGLPGGFDRQYPPPRPYGPPGDQGAPGEPRSQAPAEDSADPAAATSHAPWRIVAAAFAAEPPPLRTARRGDGPPAGRDALGIGPRLALVDAQGRHLVGATEGQAVAERPIRYGNSIVGRLTLRPAPTAARELDAAFIASQTRHMLLAGLAALVLSLIAAWLLARHLVSPIRELAFGARRIAEGWLDARIDVRREDELGELAADFNDMASRLARVEESRRAWISEASHELRTPLAVLRAEIEAMQDGVRPADAATLARLHKQVQQLAKLVDDLRLTLDRAPGSGDLERAPVAPLEILDDVVDSFRERYTAANIAIDDTRLVDHGWRIRGDAARLTQVFANLLENTLRYTHTGGRLRLSARGDGRRLRIEFDDTAPAPPASALPRLFERFFRAEPSRSRSHGGSGLGLAICKTLIEAHGGSIAASLSELGGLAVRIDLPLEKPEKKT